MEGNSSLCVCVSNLMLCDCVLLIGKWRMGCVEFQCRQLPLSDNSGLIVMMDRHVWMENASLCGFFFSSSQE